MRTEPADRIPKDQLEARRLYQINARNLRVGAGLVANQALYDFLKPIDEEYRR